MRIASPVIAPRHLLVALTLVLPTSAASAAEPYEGSWAASVADCSEPKDGNLRIIGKSYFEHEGSCSIASASKFGGAWKLNLSCEGEGEKWKKQVIVGVHGEELLLGAPVAKALKLVRCKKEARPSNWPR
jgi:hypothetical protein